MYVPGRVDKEVRWSELRLRLAPGERVLGCNRTLPSISQRRVAPVQVLRVEDERPPVLLQPVDCRRGDRGLRVHRDVHARKMRSCSVA
eukprot:scaffold59947_cov59-Phaeocystis_antarctica.AAC.4